MLKETTFYNELKPTLKFCDMMNDFGPDQV